MILYRHYKDGYHAVKPDEDCINVRITKTNHNPFCPICTSQERRMIKETNNHWNCTECGRTFHIEDIQKEDMDEEDAELVRLMRLKLKK
jgi:transposase-like protein